MQLTVWGRVSAVLLSSLLAFACTGVGANNNSNEVPDGAGSQSNIEPPPFATGTGGAVSSQMGQNDAIENVNSTTGGRRNEPRRLGQFKEACNSNEECESGWCIPFDGGNICTITCVTSDVCPTDWGCRLVVNTPPDVVSVCRPPENRYCGPCEVNEDCPGGPCRLLDGQMVCGLDCTEDADCPEASTCQEIDGVQSCVPVTRSCTCSVSRDGELRICQQENEIGRCIGRQICVGDTGWSECDAQTPSMEVCNLIDDDCNGLTDDIPGLGGVCAREATIDGDIRTCSGRLICGGDSEMPMCTAEEPTPEKCNFLDDDCDGETDEGFTTVGEVCVVGEGTCQRYGVNECAPDGDRALCSVLPGEPSAEQCDRLDNDCDGITDEDFVTLGEPCTAGVGACFRVGAVVCDDEKMGTQCSVAEGVPSAEACNGTDDDCDGKVDETHPRVGDPCVVGLGACERRGFYRCTPDGASTECSAVAGDPTDERCNGIDDNCDGTVDEGFENTGQACNAGIGACFAVGVTVCTADGREVVCNAVTTDPTEEICNDLDDDCDGSTDETFEGLDEACIVGRGICRAAGVVRCNDDGSDTECQAELIDPSPTDICNGLDDDCDGETDENFPTVNTACARGQGACRAAGILVCTADGLDVECNAVPSQGVIETCNGLDDDCDGIIDNGFPALNEQCSAGRGECRRVGFQRCNARGDGVECSVMAGEVAAETCDGSDNDCDGAVDETFANVGQACSIGVGACFSQGVWTCTADQLGTQCNAVEGPRQAETCNGQDDDCDGQTDEDFEDLANVCAVGLGICRNVGIRICSADGLTTVCEAELGQPTDEVCNGLDDNCNGVTDENHPNLGEACSRGLGLCRRTGVLVCADDAAAPAMCNAEAGVPAEQEVCDFQDDDCDGRIDESFKDGNGIYQQTQHCGACGNDCATLWQPDPGTFGVIPKCTVVGDIAQCDFDCEEGRFDADGVPNNGCEFVPDPDAVYVTTPANGGADIGDCGDYEQPCATVGRGLIRVQELARLRVLVAEGVYRESIRLDEGVELLGGHQRDTWIRNPDLFPTILFGSGGGEGPHLYTVEIRNILRPTVLDGFVINGESPLDNGGNTYAVYVIDGSQALTIRGNRIFGGNGGRGNDGNAGQSGLPGTSGAPGNPGAAQVTPAGCLPQIINLGGAGGQRICDGFNVAGGSGGGALCPLKDRREGGGTNGLGLGGGSGGLGGGGMEATPDRTACLVSDFIPVDANPGLDGADGLDAIGAVGAQNPNGQPGVHWQGQTGNDGLAGRSGSGGGGGGAAAGVDVNIIEVFGQRISDVGSSGGGGGSGGCAGQGGQGGRPGGGSFGLFIAFNLTDPRNLGDFPVVTDNEFARGLGGQGGRGGTGGGGGQGGAGGLGGDRAAPGATVMEFCSFQGGEGGAGGRGGHGGGGGGGQGGISYDVYVVGTNGLQPGYGLDNRFTIDANVPTGGPGGGGGNSSNTVTGQGGAAGDGQSGQLSLNP